MTAGTVGQVVFTAVDYQVIGLRRLQLPRASARLPLTAMGLRSKGKLEVRMKFRRFSMESIISGCADGCSARSGKIDARSCRHQSGAGHASCWRRIREYWRSMAFSADVLLIPGTPRTIQALIAGDLDYVAAGAPASLRARAQGADVMVLSTLANFSSQRRGGQGGFAVNRFQGSQRQN